MQYLERYTINHILILPPVFLTRPVASFLFIEVSRDRSRYFCLHECHATGRVISVNGDLKLPRIYIYADPYFGSHATGRVKSDWEFVA